MNILIILLGKLLSKIAQTFNLGHGSTWPGHIALKLNKHFIRDLLEKSQTKTIIIAGTNGKTTTAKLLKTIIKTNNRTVLQNTSGANLLSGIASALLLNAGFFGKIKKDFALFEVDENALSHFIKIVEPDYLVLLNLFRDQLDRYGEVNIIAAKWHDAIDKLTKTTIVINGDDPQVAFLGMTNNLRDVAFGVESNTKTTSQHDADSVYCPNCGTKLEYKSISYSHLGDWSCSKCGIKKPVSIVYEWDFYPLVGMYNKYNTHAAVLVAKELGLSSSEILNGLKEFTPAFGRQEELDISGKKVKIMLSKNPTGLNESIRTVLELGGKHILLALNDRVADGHDVSWIWDVDTEDLVKKATSIVISGDRAYDMGLRIKYSNGDALSAMLKAKIELNLEKAIQLSLGSLNNKDTLYVLPTYTAMLDIRKILTGKKIL